LSGCQTGTFAAPAAYAGKVADCHRQKKPDSANFRRLHFAPFRAANEPLPLARASFPLLSNFEIIGDRRDESSLSRLMQLP